MMLLRIFQVECCSTGVYETELRGLPLCLAAVAAPVAAGSA
jgi:hypothetical protein